MHKTMLFLLLKLALLSDIIHSSHRFDEAKCEIKGLITALNPYVQGLTYTGRISEIDLQEISQGEKLVYKIKTENDLNLIGSSFLIPISREKDLHVSIKGNNSFNYSLLLAKDTSIIENYKIGNYDCVENECNILQGRLKTSLVYVPRELLVTSSRIILLGKMLSVKSCKIGFVYNVFLEKSSNETQLPNNFKLFSEKTISAGSCYDMEVPDERQKTMIVTEDQRILDFSWKKEKLLLVNRIFQEQFPIDVYRIILKFLRKI